MRLDANNQTGSPAYDNNPWDRGHLVRRADVAWGATEQEAKDASDSTFYYTNAAPQHERFNQDEWLHLEDWVLRSAGNITSRLCVFTGPLYTTLDQFHNGLRIPSAFWKVVVLRDPTAGGDDLAALGFLMKQNDHWDDWNSSSLLDLHLYQVGIADIGGYAGIEFGELALLDEFEWRQPRFRDRSRMKPLRITGPEDISFFGNRRRERGIRALRVGQEGVALSAAPTISEVSPCNCGDGKVSTTEQVGALKTRIGELQGIIEALLENEEARPEREAFRAARTRLARIVGGDRTSPGDFPHCACIGSNGDWFCSGVLVHERVVLTAAHCAPAIDRVYLNGTSLTTVGTFGEVVMVERVFIHPDYNPNLIPSHDIAVLLLASPAETSPVEIAVVEEVNGEDNVLLVGFGYEHPSLPLGFGTKRQVDVPLSNLAGYADSEIDHAESLHGFDSVYEFHAGTKGLGQDSCNGDSGGPAYLTTDDDHKLAGITSRAAFSSELPCGDGGIYTRITPYMGWLAEVSNSLVGDEDTRPHTVVSANLYISATMPNPTGTDQGHEWIEIANNGNQMIQLDGYHVADKQGGQHPLTGILSANMTHRIVLPTNSPVKLSNSGDEIKLLYDGEVRHAVSYESAGVGQVIRFEAPVITTDDSSGTLLEGADPC